MQTPTPSYPQNAWLLCVREQTLGSMCWLRHPPATGPREVGSATLAPQEAGAQKAPAVQREEVTATAHDVLQEKPRR